MYFKLINFITTRIKTRVLLYKTATQIKRKLINSGQLEPRYCSGFHFKHLSDLMPAILYALFKLEEIRNKDNQKEKGYMSFVRRYWLSHNRLPKTLSMSIRDATLFKNLLEKGILLQDQNFDNWDKNSDIEPFYWADEELLKYWEKVSKDFV